MIKNGKKWQKNDKKWQKMAKKLKKKPKKVKIDENQLLLICLSFFCIVN